MSSSNALDAVPGMAERINVWTYWHSDERPELVESCIASWQRHPGSERYKITVVTEKSL